MQKKKKIVIPPEQIVIVFDHFDFDDACRVAAKRAVDAFFIDEDGHSKRYPELARNSYAICVRFKEYQQVFGMVGSSMNYIFEASIVVNEEDEDLIATQYPIF